MLKNYMDDFLVRFGYAFQLMSGTDILFAWKMYCLARHIGAVEA